MQLAHADRFDDLCDAADDQIDSQQRIQSNGRSRWQQQKETRHDDVHYTADLIGIVFIS